MKVLHICNDLFGSRVHANLYTHLSDRGLDEVVFAPIRQEVENRTGLLPEKVVLLKDLVIKPIHRYLYHVKRKRVFRSLDHRMDWRTCDLMHASTLFSDGGVAYLAYRKYHIPYFVTVRNTDVNLFLKLLPHTWLSGWRILLQAKRVFFVSRSMLDKFTKSWVIRPILYRIKDKLVLLPNGVDDYWCDHVRRTKTDNQRIVYVGDFSDNKNVKRLVKAVVALRRKGRFSNLQLSLVGGGMTDAFEKMIVAEKDTVLYLGEVRDRSKLCEIYRNHSIFAMPSIHETFGLVYVEALSQNLALLYTKGQGVDGMFDNCAGIGVNPLSVNEIESALTQLLDHREDYSNDSIDFERFRWREIAKCYQSFYEANMEGNNK